MPATGHADRGGALDRLRAHTAPTTIPTHRGRPIGHPGNPRHALMGPSPVARFLTWRGSCGASHRTHECGLGAAAEQAPCRAETLPQPLPQTWCSQTPAAGFRCAPAGRQGAAKPPQNGGCGVCVSGARHTAQPGRALAWANGYFRETVATLSQPWISPGCAVRNLPGNTPFPQETRYATCLG